MHAERDFGRCFTAAAAVSAILLFHAQAWPQDPAAVQDTTVSAARDTTEAEPDTAAVASSDSMVSQETGPFRRVPNRAFSVGEHLVFDVAYGMVKAGTATMSIPDTQWVEGHPCLHIVTTAESSPFFSAFFTVRDRV